MHVRVFYMLVFVALFIGLTVTFLTILVAYSVIFNTLSVYMIPRRVDVSVQYCRVVAIMLL